jgi:transcriptional regulator with XRE-family HTH domain
MFWAMLDLPHLGAALRLTKAALAERAGVARSTIDALETGRIGELGFNRITRILGSVGLGLRVTEARQGRPTYDDLVRDDDR